MDASENTQANVITYISKIPMKTGQAHAITECPALIIPSMFRSLCPQLRRTFSCS